MKILMHLVAVLIIFIPPLQFVVLNIWLLIRWQRVWRWIAAIPAAIFCICLVKLLLDWLTDPKSHNLWPFEIFFLSAVGSLFLGIASLVRVCLRPGKQSNSPAA